VTAVLAEIEETRTRSLPSEVPPVTTPEAVHAAKVTILDRGLVVVAGCGHATGIEAVHRLRALLSLDRKAAVVGAVGATFDLDKGIDRLELAQ
jgi:metal-dependent hydrolase (beta-lactamase superfamily II)